VHYKEVERRLITKYCPVLNDQFNWMRSAALNGVPKDLGGSDPTLANVLLEAIERERRAAEAREHQHPNLAAATDGFFVGLESAARLGLGSSAGHNALRARPR
jgi:hypothetical protein